MSENDSDNKLQGLFENLEEYLFDMDENIRKIKNWIVFWSVFAITVAVISVLLWLKTFSFLF